jgi:hypothetical protein
LVQDISCGALKVFSVGSLCIGRDDETLPTTSKPRSLKLAPHFLWIHYDLQPTILPYINGNFSLIKRLQIQKLSKFNHFSPQDNCLAHCNRYPIPLSSRRNCHRGPVASLQYPTPRTYNIPSPFTPPIPTMPSSLSKALEKELTCSVRAQPVPPCAH